MTPQLDPISISPDSGRRVITFHRLNHSAYPACEPLDELKALVGAGAMPKARARGGDCSMIAGAMMADLRDAGVAHRWAWVAGACIRIGRHHWIEAAGWAVDCSHRATRAALVLRATTYRLLRGAEYIRTITAPAPALTNYYFGLCQRSRRPAVAVLLVGYPIEGPIAAPRRIADTSSHAYLILIQQSPLVR